MIGSKQIGGSLCFEYFWDLGPINMTNFGNEIPILQGRVNSLMMANTVLGAFPVRAIGGMGAIGDNQWISNWP